MKRIIIIISFLGLLLPVSAQQPDTLISSANDAYANEFYDNAIDRYQQVLEMGYESPELYFNLGNAYFKSEDYPSAILYYEKAKKLDPRDDDIRHNLEVANARIIDKIEPVPELFLKTWWRSFVNMFSSNTWSTIAVIGFILVFITLAFYMLSRMIRIRKVAFFSGLGFLAITIVAFTVAWHTYSKANKDHEAIVFTPTITVKSSPSPNSVDLFVIHEGAKVELLDQVGNWYEIRIASGSVGWLPLESVKKI
ncbi:MAG: tetratricopeptide repeat protein [Bacteroidales bacterium]|nr:tetratricopeptide repeat protein [Bacteroidales bacterium]